MTLAVGARLGPYEVLGSLGAGGMGEVYKARDTRLGRDVAIKVLPAHVSSDPERRARFEREARAISGLSHPHVCALYDVGEQDGVAYLVMEYLEGETLAQRLQRGPLPPDQVLRYGMQIADALARAHKQGIVHRDLKPGNVMLTKTGAKLLDFGLAKAHLPGASAASVLSQMPTDEKPLTTEGALLGTFQYMAPEQLEGREADERSDIWALGCVLYEMATCRRAFSGQSQASLISAILKEEPPPVAQVQPMAPPALDHVVRTCLAKDPDERWQSAHDVVRELAWIAAGGSQAGLLAPAMAPRRRRREWLAWALATLVACAATAILARRLAVPGDVGPRRPVRLLVNVQSEMPLSTPGFPNAIAITRDGRQLAYCRDSPGGRALLHLRPLDRLEATPLAGTEGAYAPVFSPEGQWLAFFSQGKLKKVLVTGGPVLMVADAPDPRGAFWAPDDTILFTPLSSGGVWRVPATGGAPREITKLDTSAGETGHAWPELLPGGRKLLYTVRTDRSWDEGRIAAQDLETGERRTVVEGGFHGRYALTGHLVFARAGSLMAVSFDPARALASGTPTPVLQGVVTAGAWGWNQAAFSEEGTLVYVPSTRTAPKTLLWVDRQGRSHPALDAVQPFEHPRLSPDGKRALVGIRAPAADIWLADFARGTLTRLTHDAGEDESAVWTPDGRSVTWAASRGPAKRVTMIGPADGGGAEVELVDHQQTREHQHLGGWSPDGGFLAFTRIRFATATAWDIFMIPKEGKAAVPFLQTPFAEQAPAFSPDGRFLAYASDESGVSEVYVQAFPGPGGKWQVSTDGGSEPLWSRNGRELFYRSGDKMMAVAVTTRPAFEAGAPQVLFHGRFDWIPWGERNYDVSPDGSRFLMVSAGGESGGTLNVVLNWFEELKGRPGDR